MKFGKPDSGLSGQFIRYVFSGGIAALVHLLVMVLLIELIGMSKVISSGVGFVIGSLVNFLIMRNLVFGTARAGWSALVRYSTVTSITLCLNLLLFKLATQYFGMHYLLAQLLVIGGLVLVNFALNRAFTFSAPAPKA